MAVRHSLCYRIDSVAQIAQCSAAPDKDTQQQYTATHKRCDVTNRKQLTPRCLGLLSEFQSSKQMTLMALMIAPALMQYICVVQESSL
eukprot:3002-Heterococcus_DN1.PRE.2